MSQSDTEIISVILKFDLLVLFCFSYWFSLLELLREFELFITVIEGPNGCPRRRGRQTYTRYSSTATPYTVCTHFSGSKHSSWRRNSISTTISHEGEMSLVCISPSTVSLFQAQDWNRPRPLSDRAPNQNLVPEPTDEAEEGTPRCEGNKRAGAEEGGPARTRWVLLSWLKIMGYKRF